MRKAFRCKCRILGALLIVLLPALLFLNGCGKHESPVEIGNRTGVFHIGNGAEPRNLDPTTASSVTESNILTSLFEGLVTFSPDCTSILPGAAERWDVSADGKTYTFHLRPGMKWSNGDPLDSGDFLYAFRRLIEPSLGAELAISADWVVGARNYREGKAHDLAAVGFRAPDPLTFVIELNERTPFLLGMLTTNPFYPVQRATLEKHDAYLRRESDWTRPGSLVCNGAFRLKSWRTNDAVVVEKNPFYWNAAGVRLQQVYYHAIDNADAEERAFRGGLLHATIYIPTVKLAEYRKEHPDVVHTDPLVATTYLDFNTARPPFNDVRVRRAFAMAIDRAALVGKVVRDDSRVAVSLAVPGSGGYEPRVRTTCDPAQARSFLAAAGFPGGVHFPAVSMLLPQGASQALIEALQAMWQQELGVHVDLVVKEEKVWLDAMRTKDFQVIAMSWTSAVNDPSDMLQNWLSQSPNNSTGWASAAYDAQYAAAGQSASDAERLAHFQNADAILADEVPATPLYHKNQSYLVARSVHNWHDNLLDYHPPGALFLAPASGGQ